MKLYDVIRKEEMGEEVEDKKLPEIQVESPKKNTLHHFVHHRHVNWRKILIIGCAIAFIALLYVIGMRVVHAKVVITERRIPFTLDAAEFELIHEGEGSINRLSYQTMVVPTEVSRQVYGSQIEPSTSYAKGKVVFFNEYSTKAQTIKAKTTVTSKEGKKYQTTESVSVPGYTLKNKVKTAGTSAATSVIATAVGPASNTTGTSFSVAGYGKTMYAQSAGAITGGEDGLRHSVAPSDRDDIVASLQAQLIERLKRETRAQIPQDLITFPDLQVASVNTDSLVLKGEGIKFPASISGTMTTYLIPSDMLESAIASQVLNDRSYPKVTIPDLSALTVTPITALPADPDAAPDTIRIEISGEGTIITKAPVAAILDSLVGAPKKDFSHILGNIPEVDSAEYHFYPFWAPFFPAKNTNITVEAQ